MLPDRHRAVLVAICGAVFLGLAAGLSSCSGESAPAAHPDPTGWAAEDYSDREGLVDGARLETAVGPLADWGGLVLRFRSGTEDWASPAIELHSPEGAGVLNRPMDGPPGALLLAPSLWSGGFGVEDLRVDILLVDHDAGPRLDAIVQVGRAGDWVSLPVHTLSIDPDDLPDGVSFGSPFGRTSMDLAAATTSPALWSVEWEAEGAEVAFEVEIAALGG